MDESVPGNEKNKKNEFSSNSYRAIQFTCRQLIKYKNPFLLEFTQIKKQAKLIFAENQHTEGPHNTLLKKIIEMDVSSAAKDTRFFYPFEVQIVDVKNHELNSIGEASHQDYKKSQLKKAMIRLFLPLIKYKNIKIPIDSSHA
ncbi:MAG: hypothetical protein HQK53_19370 [Oligoflexia bacterium]|nr:hypothetical protein [Oligoflexia bacterium]